MSILKIINGPNNNRDFIPSGHRYITDSTKTENGKCMGTINCSSYAPAKVSDSIYSLTENLSDLHPSEEGAEE